jgi:Mg-chelatase subunit ChlD
MSGSLSSGWSSGTSIIHSGWTADKGEAYRMMKHKNHLDGLAKIVDPTIKHSLDYATDSQSYCDMATGNIRVDGSLILEDDDKLDVVAGLTIHEKLHLVHSNILMKHLQSKRYDIIEEYGSLGFQLYKNLSNLVEDEYIESQLPKTCPGYVSYISAVKDHYWGDSAEELTDIDEPFGDLMGSILLYVRYPSSLSAPQKKRWANDLRIVEDILKKDGLDEEGRLVAIHKLWVHMLKRAEQLGYGKDKDTCKSKFGDAIKDEIKGYGEYLEKEFSDITEEEKKELLDSQTKKIKDYYKNKFEESKRTPVEDAMERMGEALRKLMAELTGEQEKGTISETLQKEIKTLIDSDYHEYKIEKGDAPAMNQRKVSWQKVLPKSNERHRYVEHKKAMRSVIGKLKRKIQLYGNPNKLTITNQKRGKLNKRMLHRIPSGRDDLFKVVIRKEDNPLDVCLLVDESGSMRYRTMDKAREACIAVKESLQDNDKLNLWVFGHSGDEQERYATEMYEYASPTMQDRPMACGAMTARYENRDGVAIMASAEKVRNESINPTTKKLMIIFSDGQPSAAGYRGQRAMEHVKKSVKKAESMGFSVIQVGFAGAYGRYQEQMFDNHVYCEDMQKLPLQISKILQKVMKL